MSARKEPARGDAESEPEAEDDEPKAVGKTQPSASSTEDEADDLRPPAFFPRGEADEEADGLANLSTPARSEPTSYHRTVTPEPLSSFQNQLQTPEPSQQRPPERSLRHQISYVRTSGILPGTRASGELTAFIRAGSSYVPASPEESVRPPRSGAPSRAASRLDVRLGSTAASAAMAEEAEPSEASPAAADGHGSAWDGRSGAFVPAAVPGEHAEPHIPTSLRRPPAQPAFLAEPPAAQPAQAAQSMREADQQCLQMAELTGPSAQAEPPPEYVAERFGSPTPSELSRMHSPLKDAMRSLELAESEGGGGGEARGDEAPSACGGGAGAGKGQGPWAALLALLAPPAARRTGDRRKAAAVALCQCCLLLALVLLTVICLAALQARAAGAEGGGGARGGRNATAAAAAAEASRLAHMPRSPPAPPPALPPAPPPPPALPPAASPMPAVGVWAPPPSPLLPPAQPPLPPPRRPPWPPPPAASPPALPPVQVGRAGRLRGSVRPPRSGRLSARTSICQGRGWYACHSAPAPAPPPALFAEELALRALSADGMRVLHEVRFALFLNLTMQLPQSALLTVFAGAPLAHPLQMYAHRATAPSAVLSFSLEGALDLRVTAGGRLSLAQHETVVFTPLHCAEGDSLFEIAFSNFDGRLGAVQPARLADGGHAGEVRTGQWTCMRGQGACHETCYANEHLGRCSEACFERMATQRVSYTILPASEADGTR